MAHIGIFLLFLISKVKKKNILNTYIKLGEFISFDIIKKMIGLQSMIGPTFGEAKCKF